jgi:hypothetical protein
MLQNFQSSFAAREYWNKTLVDVEGPEFAAAEPVNRRGYVCDEFGELRLVVRRHRLASLLTI